MIEFDGRLWRPMTYEEAKECTGKEVLLCHPHEGNMYVIRINHIFVNNASISFHYESPTPWGTHSGGFYLEEELTWWYLPAESIDATLCYCSGPAENKWCFDTNTVEPLCCRCHKRKVRHG